MVVGASAGGFTALERLLCDLPAGFPAAVLVVLHLQPDRTSLLASLLARHASMPLKWAVDEEAIQAGTVYVAVPNFHLEAVDGRIRLTKSAVVHFTRPAVDRLFESVAADYGARTVGVVLSGSGVDGADGVVAIRRAGGTTIAQTPGDAAYPGMPQAAIATGCVDLVVPLADVARALVALRSAPGATPAEG